MAAAEAGTGTAATPAPLAERQVPASRNPAQPVVIPVRQAPGKQQAFVLDVGDIHFNFDSAVLLADYDSTRCPPPGPDEVRVTGLAALRAVFVQLDAQPKQTLFIAGHTDRVGSPAYNQTLSERRAKNILFALLGKRQDWIASSRTHHQTQDVQQILKWVSENWPIACDPGPITGKDNAATQKALKEFQTDQRFHGPTPATGQMNDQTWGAFFDLYMVELGEILGQGDAGLKSRQAALPGRFIAPNRQAAGFGERFPREQPNVDELKSATNRRVEVLFFDPGEQPAKNDDLYDDKKFVHPFTQLPCEGIPKVVLRLTSPRIPDAQRATHGAPVAVNDDADNGQLYPAAPPAGHTELEPIIDLDHLQATAAEDDLLETNLTLLRTGLAGDVTLTAVQGGNLIRLWPAATKGVAADVIALPATLPANTLPRQIFVEGLASGTVILEVSYPYRGRVRTDRLQVNVVELLEDQGAARKIIYDYNSDIRFRVLGAPANYAFEWDFDGDGTFAAAAVLAEAGRTTATETIKYGGAAAADTILLVENAANRRQVFNVGVRMTGGFVLNVKGTTIENGAARRGIRVALATHQGTALPAQSTAGLHTIFAWSNTVPVTFDPTNAAHSGANRISFNAALGPNAETHFTPAAGAGRRVLFVDVGPNIWNTGQMREDLIGTVNHEAEHLNQHVAVRDNVPANNPWRLMDNFHGGPAGYRDFREAGGHFTEVADTTLSWLHQRFPGQNDLSQFRNRYTAALAVYNGMAAGAARTAARGLLQDWYRRTPFFEMKRAGYDFIIQPPGP